MDPQAFADRVNQKLGEERKISVTQAKAILAALVEEESLRGVLPEGHPATVVEPPRRVTKST